MVGAVTEGLSLFLISAALLDLPGDLTTDALNNFLSGDGSFFLESPWLITYSKTGSELSMLGDCDGD